MFSPIQVVFQYESIIIHVLGGGIDYTGNIYHFLQLCNQIRRIDEHKNWMDRNYEEIALHRTAFCVFNWFKFLKRLKPV